MRMRASASGAVHVCAKLFGEHRGPQARVVWTSRAFLLPTAMTYFGGGSIGYNYSDPRVPRRPRATYSLPDARSRVWVRRVRHALAGGHYALGLPCLQWWVGPVCQVQCSAIGTPCGGQRLQGAHARGTARARATGCGLRAVATGRGRGTAGPGTGLELWRVRGTSWRGVARAGAYSFPVSRPSQPPCAPSLTQEVSFTDADGDESILALKGCAPPAYHCVTRACASLMLTSKYTRIVVLRAAVYCLSVVYRSSINSAQTACASQ